MLEIGTNLFALHLKRPHAATIPNGLKDSERGVDGLEQFFGQTEKKSPTFDDRRKGRLSHSSSLLGGSNIIYIAPRNEIHEYIYLSSYTSI